MATINNRKKPICGLMEAIQACVSNKTSDQTLSYLGSSILNLDAATMVKLRKETSKIIQCEEARRFRHKEVENLLLEAAGETIIVGHSRTANANAATTRFLSTLKSREQGYYVAFAVPGIHMLQGNASVLSLKIGSCEFCPDYKSLKAAYASIRVPVYTSSSARHLHFRKGFVVAPADETVVVIRVFSSSRFAHDEALACLEEAYGFFVLWYDQISGSRAPGSSNTRQPLISWQARPKLYPHGRVAMEPLSRNPQLRMGLGSEEAWFRSYNVDLEADLPKLKSVGFDAFNTDLFDTHADTEIGLRIKVALRWLTRALQAEQPELKFLSYAIALETMFTARSHEYRIGALIRECVARIANWNDAKKVRQLVSDLYGRRSGIVHQGNIAQFTNESETMHVIVCGCLISFFENGDHRRSYTEMLTRIGLNLEEFRQDIPVKSPVTWSSWIAEGLSLLRRKSDN